MFKEKLDGRFTAIIFIVFAAAIVRVLTNGLIPNFTPIGALAIFSGAYFQDKKLAVIVPVSALLLSDLYIGFHSTMPFVYISFLMIVLMSSLINGGRKTVGTVLGSTLAGTALFYLVTNFGVWALTGMYEMTFSGLLTSYIAGIPFIRYSLMGDLFYVGVLFGVFELVRHYVLPSLKVA